MLKRVAKVLLWFGGWTAVGGTPPVPKAVIIAAPHTSNWDAYWALVYKVAAGLDVHFFGKHTVFWFPLGTLLRSLGGIPLDRRKPGSAIQTAVDEFHKNDSYYFGLAPEGTRSLKPYWKTGFYRIAEQANVPVLCGFLDFANKKVGLGPVIEITGDREADLAQIREFYSGIQGKNPENTSPIGFPPDK
ncbi:MAG: lysophospholipid acyltransferase family protein [Gammaproteobacteria bacterium]|nr:lysophospholipid acyltransferase family protein [Gammaproteobacteria bacterium]